MINNISLVYFSPTKTSKKIVEAIAQGVHIENIVHHDLTYRIDELKEIGNDLVIFGIPVYSGRLPNVAVERLRKIKGNNSPAIVVVLYGNREYEDALIELKNIVIEQGFDPFAAAAFIGEHSYSSDIFPIAQGRPDLSDLSKAKEFGISIKETLEQNGPLNDSILVPGNYPYKISGVRHDISPVTIESKCNLCGICASVCPTNSIEINKIVQTDSSTCILCCACIKECPNMARLNDNDYIKSVSERLYKNGSLRKEPEIFI